MGTLATAAAAATATASTAPPSEPTDSTDAAGPATGIQSFDHVGTFDVIGNLGEGEDVATPTVAEIVAASEDGNTLVYTDAVAGRIGFVDITDASAPAPLGAIDAGGDPTSVAVAGSTVFAVVNTGTFTEPAGTLMSIDLTTREITGEIDLAGQPDSTAVSPDGAYLAVVIENERDENVYDGIIPQLPAGLVQIFPLAEGAISGDPVDVDLTGIAGYAADDPEPEFVDINGDNVAVVSLQENNWLALIDLTTGEVSDSFSAGTTTLEHIDVADDALIEYTETQTERRREPDAVAWIGNELFATANEGDYTDEAGVEGGSRSFTIFDTAGDVVFESGSSFELEVARAGHYPDGRSDAKGVEPEGVEVGTFGDRTLLFVGSERANVVGVYDVTTPESPEFLQLLPTGIGPEGVKAITERGLLVVSAEVDGLAEEPDDQFPVRALITLYELGDAPARYPYIGSDDETAGVPVPWVGLSGLAGDPADAGVLWSVSDSALDQAWIYRIDVTSTPARITERIAVGAADGSLDLEGIAARPEGGFWLASEGDAEETNNVIVRTDADGTIVGNPIPLPEDVAATATSNGFEGVAVTGTEATSDEVVWIAQQREWEGDAEGLVKIGRYDVAAGEWTFAAYPLDAPESPAGGWVGLSEITVLPDGTFAIVERDNQIAPDAAIKRVYTVDPASVTFVAAGEVLPVLEKTLYADILPVLDAASMSVPDKVEGFGVTADGRVWIVTDNDGVDANFGETVFVELVA